MLMMRYNMTMSGRGLVASDYPRANILALGVNTHINNHNLYLRFGTIKVTFKSLHYRRLHFYEKDKEKEWTSKKIGFRLLRLGFSLDFSSKVILIS